MAITIRELQVRIRPGHLPWDDAHPYDTLDLVLDGRGLEDWLRPLTPRAHRDAGGYLGHHVDVDLEALLLGRWPGDAEDFGGRTALMGCECTVVGCAPLVCRIQVDEDTVTWSDFSRFRGPAFDYEPVAFVFDRDVYQRAAASRPLAPSND